MKFIADENFPVRAVARLRDAGFDVTWVGDGDAGASDDQVLQLCAASNRVLLTLDLERLFHRCHARANSYAFSSWQNMTVGRYWPKCSIREQKLPTGCFHDTQPACAHERCQPRDSFSDCEERF